MSGDWLKQTKARVFFKWALGRKHRKKDLPKSRFLFWVSSTKELSYPSALNQVVVDKSKSRRMNKLQAFTFENVKGDGREKEKRCMSKRKSNRNRETRNQVPMEVAAESAKKFVAVLFASHCLFYLNHLMYFLLYFPLFGSYYERVGVNKL